MKYAICVLVAVCCSLVSASDSPIGSPAVHRVYEVSVNLVEHRGDTTRLLNNPRFSVLADRPFVMAAGEAFDYTSGYSSTLRADGTMRTERITDQMLDGLTIRGVVHSLSEVLELTAIFVGSPTFVHFTLPGGEMASVPQYQRHETTLVVPVADVASSPKDIDLAPGLRLTVAAK